MKFYHILYSKYNRISKLYQKANSRTTQTTISLLLQDSRKQKVSVRMAEQSQRSSTDTTKQGDDQCWPFGRACWSRHGLVLLRMLPMHDRSQLPPAWWWRVVV